MSVSSAAPREISRFCVAVVYTLHAETPSWIVERKSVLGRPRRVSGTRLGSGDPEGARERNARPDAKSQFRRPRTPPRAIVAASFRRLSATRARAGEPEIAGDVSPHGRASVDGGPRPRPRRRDSARALRSRSNRVGVPAEPVPNLSPSTGRLSGPKHSEVPGLPPRRGAGVPLIRPGAAASARADPLEARRSPRPSPRSRLRARGDRAAGGVRPNARARTPEHRKCRSAARRPGRVRAARDVGGGRSRTRHRCGFENDLLDIDARSIDRRRHFAKFAKSPRLVRARRAGGERRVRRGARAIRPGRGIRPGVERNVASARGVRAQDR